MLRESTASRVSAIARSVAAALGRYEWLQLRERLGRPAAPAAWERAHERTAGALHDLGIDLAGLFVKVCQVAGARADVFPAPFARRLGRFHDRVPPRPFAVVRPWIERELGRPLDALFAQVDETPLAAASLAQVHRATLRDGARVVLKVQYPEIAGLARVDLASLRRAVRVVARLEPSFDFRSIVEEVAEFVALELDFAREAATTERIREAFAGDPTVRVPRVYREHCTGKLLVLEYLDGIKITDLERLSAAGVDLRAAATRVAGIYARMIFEHGFFQADPHPGNLLVLPDGAIGLLDFGLAKELPAGFGRAVAAMIVHGLAGNAAGAVAAARAAGFEVADGSPAALVALILAFMGDREGETGLRDLLRETPVSRVPSHFGLIARVMLLLNGLSHVLAPGEMAIQRAFVEVLASQVDEAAAPPTERLPPGPEGPPLLQALRWIRWPIPLMEECARSYGECFTLRFPGSPPIVFFSHPDAIRDIFTGNEDDLRAGEANFRLEPLLGRHSLLLLDGQEHLRERRMLQPPFHGERMQAYGDVMRAVADRAIDAWPTGRAFPIHPEMQGITLDVILRTVFGLREGAELVALRARLAELLAVVVNPDLLLVASQASGNGRGPVARSARIRDEVDALLFAEIARRRAAGTDGRDDVLSMLLEARDEDGALMTDQELRDELVTLLVAGHETTATALAWALHQVLAHPRVLERLRAELRTASEGGAPSPQEVARVEYLDAVV